MNYFFQLFEESVIIQGLVTLVVVSSVCYLYISGQGVPEGMLTLLYAIIGFWFGSKSEYVIRRSRKK